MEKEPIVGIENFSDSAIIIGYRYWVPTNSFFKTQNAVNLKVLDALNKAKVAILFPQRGIRMLGDEK